MTFLQFTSNLIEFLSWPITIMIIVFSFREIVNENLKRLLKLKFKDIELTLADTTKAIIEKKNVSKEEIEKQIKVKNEIYRLYSNGILVNRWKVKLKSNQKKETIIFPITFPNEVLNIQFIGLLNYKILEINKSNFTFEYELFSENLEIELIVSGI